MSRTTLTLVEVIDTAPIHLHPPPPTRPFPAPERRTVGSVLAGAALTVAALLLLIPLALAVTAPVLLLGALVAALFLGLLHPLVVVILIGVPLADVLICYALDRWRAR